MDKEIIKILVGKYLYHTRQALQLLDFVFILLLRGTYQICIVSSDFKNWPVVKALRSSLGKLYYKKEH